MSCPSHSQGYWLEKAGLCLQEGSRQSQQASDLEGEGNSGGRQAAPLEPALVWRYLSSDAGGLAVSFQSTSVPVYGDACSLPAPRTQPAAIP